MSFINHSFTCDPRCGIKLFHINAFTCSIHCRKWNQEHSIGQNYAYDRTYYTSKEISAQMHNKSIESYIQKCLMRVLLLSNEVNRLQLYSVSCKSRNL